MATAMPARAEIEPHDQCVVLRGVGWNGYATLLRLRSEGRRPKLVYVNGELHLVSPSYTHEEFADRLSDLVKTVCVELDLPYKSSRSTTFRQRKKDAGAEADASFYLKNAGRIRGLKTLDLRRDPPPDLVIEAVNTHGASVEVWRRFGVPEVWVADASRVQILAVQDDGRYLEVTNSVAFPSLAAAEVFDWMTREVGESDTDWIKAVRAWARDVLLPRAKGGE